ncbi:SCO2524 family protein [Frankia sp. R82]|nr:SCO2524 family protein [Frankia sp. R82]
MLELWQAASAYSHQKGEWQFGGRAQPNSTADAEQLLCLMYPATAEASYFRLEQPDRTGKDVAQALQALGEPIEIPQVLLRAVSTFMRRYSDEDGLPVFHGGAYLQATQAGHILSPEDRRIDIVDSMSMSITLCLATLGFFKEYRRTGIRRAQLLRDVEWLENAASTRLTAAMVGLLRSFTVHTFSPTSTAGAALLRTVDQDGYSEEQLLARLRASLNSIRADLPEATDGTTGLDGLENENHLFECGWSWGVVHGAPAVEADLPESAQKPGRAVARPNLYFTLSALDGIADLSSERTRRLNLLTSTQQSLSRRLQLRWELAQRYWSAIADFGDRRTALADIPWQPTDRAGGESPVTDHYYSLQVAGMVIENLHQRRPAENELASIAQILAELAIRARVTRRASQQETAVEMHVPGLEIPLAEADGKPVVLAWRVTDFATALLKRTMRLVLLARSAELRQQLLDLADEIWGHVEQRMILDGPGAGLWDDPRRPFPGLPDEAGEPSWYFTERVVECLVAAVSVIDMSPVTNVAGISAARTMLSEADHLYHRELLNGALNAGGAMRAELEDVAIQIDRARAAVERRPGTAQAILLEVLRRLNSLEAARPSIVLEGRL